MKVRFDALNRAEVPTIILCNPGSVYDPVNDAPTKVVGIIGDSSHEEAVLNFNQISGLNFVVTKVIRGRDVADDHALKIYNGVQPRRMVFVRDMGFFSITSVDETLSESGVYTKDVTCESAEVEFQNRKVPYIEDGTYRLSDDNVNNEQGLLQKIISVIPLWGVGFVDPAIEGRYRTFEDISGDTNALSFIMNDMQDAYECIFVFDTINRTISVYSQDNYVFKTSVLITRSGVIKDLNIKEDASDLYTAISVVSDGNLTISGINPLGGRVIYNFDYYIDWMTAALGQKVVAWQNAVDDSMDDYYNHNVVYYSKLGEAATVNYELERLSTILSMYKRCRDNVVAESKTTLVGSYNSAIVANGGEPITIHAQIQDTLDEIDNSIAIAQNQYDNTLAQLDFINADITSIRVLIDGITGSLSMDTYFTEEELLELQGYVFEGSYSDDHIIITDQMTYPEQLAQMRELYNKASDILTKASRPTQEFSVDTESFIFAQEFEHLTSQIETGCIIGVEINDGDVADLFLSNMTVNYEDMTTSMTFGNRYNRFDPKSLFNGVLGKITKTANTLSKVRDVLYPIKDGELNRMRDAIQSSRDITMRSTLSASDEMVVIDGSGYTGKSVMEDGKYDPRQIKIVSNSIVFTDDAWKTSRTAVGEVITGDGESSYGINAELLMGDLIVGNRLSILDKNGNELLGVIDGKISSAVEGLEGQITQLSQTSDGLSILIQAVEDRLDEPITEITTTTGYKFGADGLVIHQAGSEMRNLIDNTGMYVTRGNTDILTANNEGVSALNLSARQYLIVGKNTRFEDYDDGTDSNRTGCFYIGS